MNGDREWDHVIVGGGVLGASFASALLALGRKVALFERFSRPAGGSVRNFGLAWPHIAPDPASLSLGLRTVGIYRRLASEFEFGWNPCGAMLVAENGTETSVIADFQRRSSAQGLESRLLDAKDALGRHPWLRSSNVCSALFIPEGGALDPREFVGRWLSWMSEHQGLAYFPATTVVKIEESGNGLRIDTAAGDRHRAESALVCGGEEFQTLFPATFTRSGIRRCKLAMLQTTPGDLPPGVPGLAFGRSLRHYPLFSASPAFSRLEAEGHDPDCERLGVHLLVKPAADGSLVLGDSHEYTAPEEPHDFDHTAEAEALILKLARHHLAGFPQDVSRRWLGYYAKHPVKPWVEEHPLPNVTVLSGLTIGMSVGPAFAQDHAERLLAFRKTPAVTARP